MKKLLTIAIATLGFAVFSVFAADKGKSIPYTATVTGVVCASCKAHITHAFKKLPGVEEIRFAKGDKDGTQVVSFNAASESLAREDVIKALGEDAKHYQVIELQKVNH